jgi:hypothetical protein
MNQDWKKAIDSYSRLGQVQQPSVPMGGALPVSCSWIGEWVLDFCQYTGVDVLQRAFK